MEEGRGAGLLCYLREPVGERDLGVHSRGRFGARRHARALVVRCASSLSAVAGGAGAAATCRGGEEEKQSGCRRETKSSTSSGKKFGAGGLQTDRCAALPAYADAHFIASVDFTGSPRVGHRGQGCTAVGLQPSCPEFFSRRRGGEGWEVGAAA